ALAGVAGQRSAFGFNAVAQVVLAVLLLVAVNLISTGWRLPEEVRPTRPSLAWMGEMKGYNARIDLTREKVFTLPEDLRKELETLDPNSRTTIIVYLRHKTFAGVNVPPEDDVEDVAAAAKVIEKVNDLVELLREAGPRFEVKVVDARSKGFKAKMAELEQQSPELVRPIR